LRGANATKQSSFTDVLGLLRDARNDDLTEKKWQTQELDRPAAAT